MRGLAALVVAILGLGGAAGAQTTSGGNAMPEGEVHPVVVPRAVAAPLLDGEVGAAEWAGALHLELADGRSAQLMADNSFLYLAMRSPGRSVGSLCLARGDTVRVLHASAALGTVVYPRDGETWRLVAPFEFQVRDRDRSPDAERKRGEFLAANGWVATTAFMGEREPGLEFRIARALLDPGRATLGIAERAAGPDGTIRPFPRDMSDGCAASDLVTGSAPDHVAFRPESWLQLRLP